MSAQPGARIGVPAAAAAPAGAMASRGLRELALIALFVVLVACVPLVTASGSTLNFVMMALYATLMAQAAGQHHSVAKPPRGLQER